MAQNKWEELKETFANLEDDAKKFYEKGNKAAGVRIRGGMQDIKALAQEIRKEIVEQRHEGKE